MERLTKPQDLFIGRKRSLTFLAALAFFTFGAALAILLPIALVKNPPDDEKVLIMLCISSGVVSAVSLINSALNIRNLFFPYLLTADEKGVYNYSGFFHFGFVAWEDIQSIGKDPTLLDVLDNDAPCLRIYVKDLNTYKTKLSFFKKAHLFFSGGNVKIFTLTSQIKRKQLFTLLEDMRKYYGEPEQTVTYNE